MSGSLGGNGGKGSEPAARIMHKVLSDEERRKILHERARVLAIKEEPGHRHPWRNALRLRILPQRREICLRHQICARSVAWQKCGEPALHPAFHHGCNERARRDRHRA